MKFRPSRDVFSDAVQWTSRAVQQRPTIPILSAVKISARENEVEFSTFDYEVSARSRVEAVVTEAGEALVSGRLITEIAKALPNQDVVLTLNDNHVDVECGRAKFALQVMPIEDYPDLPTLPTLAGKVDGQAFSQAVSQVAIATSKDDTLPLLTGVRVEIDGSRITLLATDRYRLALRELEWNPESPSFSTEFLVKARVLNDVARNLGGGGAVDVSLTQGGATERAAIIGFSAGERQATSSLMDGDYPPVRKLFPEVTPMEYVCARQELLEAVKRVSLVVERKTPVRLVFEDGALTLDAGAGESAQAQEAVPLVAAGDPLRTAFNPEYLRDGLASLDTEFVRFGFTDANKAAVMMGQPEENGEGDSMFKYLLMPIRFGA